ncbi:MAG: hypothetical protein HRT89_12235 [Lentisphaeria bacterium]|nr:hypothetical protein [Lentisphaeria bacterium]NQZ68826.1 hypothetical protein [Lentisphaeria bacterium]
MRKYLIIHLLSLLILQPVVLGDPEKKESVPSIQIGKITDTKKIVIDGDLKDWVAVPSVYLPLRPSVSIIPRARGAFFGEKDLSASFNLLWDETAITVAITVNDERFVVIDKDPNNIWMNDSVELFFDFDWQADRQTAKFNDDDVQYLLSPLAAFGQGKDTWFSPQKGVEKITFKSKRIPGGYTIEARIPVPKKYRQHLKQGGIIGFNLGVNDTDWALAGGNAWESQHRWCNRGKPNKDARSRNKIVLSDKAGLDLDSRLTIGTLNDYCLAGKALSVQVAAGIPMDGYDMDINLHLANNAKPVRVPLLKNKTLKIGRQLISVPIPDGHTGNATLEFLIKKNKKIVLKITQPIRVEKLLNQFRSILPKGHISDKAVFKKWQIIDWKSKHHKGQILISHREAGVPALSIPLNVSGWHAVSIGFWMHDWAAMHAGGDVTERLKLRLTGDKNWWTSAMHKNPDGFPASELHFEEQFLFMADLTGKNLEIAHDNGTAGVGFIRLIPLSSAQIKQAKSKDVITWNITNDGHSKYFENWKTPVEKMIHDWIDPYPGTIFKEHSQGIILSDTVNYPSKVAGRFGDTKIAGPMVRPIDRKIWDNIGKFLNAGHDPMKMIRQRTRKQKKDLWFYLRTQAWTLEAPYAGTFPSPFYYKNPQWRCKTRDDRSLAHMSWAFPEVRQYLINILKELAAYDPEGINIMFNRGGPLSFFEAPVLADFKKKYGKDIRNANYRSKEVFEIRKIYTTLFLQELRQALKKMGKQKVKISVTTFQTESLNLEYGLDLKAWAKSGLVDRIQPFLWEPKTYDQVVYHTIDLNYYKRVVAGTKCKLVPFGYNNNLDKAKLPRDARRSVLKYYRQGFKQLCGWDMSYETIPLDLMYPGKLEVWDAISNPLPIRKIITLDGMALDVSSPHYGM